MKICRGIPWRLPAAVIVSYLALGPAPAFAQGSCIQDQWKADGNRQKLTCTANDVRIADASNIREVDGETELTSCTAGERFSFVADFRTVLGAQERFDIGLYFGTDGDANNDGAITGVCDVNVIGPKSNIAPFLGSANFVQLDASPDSCGDINDNNNPQIVTVRVDNVLCQDSDGDEMLNLPNCTSWRQSGANEVCQNSANAFPGSPSKCNCDPDFNIPVRVEIGTIEVTKSVTPASLPEPGGTFTFTVAVKSLATSTSIDINRICDSDHGTIFDSTETGCPDGSLGVISAGSDCGSATLTPPDNTEYSCTFDAIITSNTPVPSQQDTVTVFGVDENGNLVEDSDVASIAITDAPPAAMVTKKFEGIECVEAQYSVSVKNTSTADDLTLTALSDSQFGSLTAPVGTNVVFTTCAVPQTIAVGGEYDCSFNANFCSAQHTNQATATLNDDENNVVNPQSAEVTVDVTATAQ